VSNAPRIVEYRDKLRQHLPSLEKRYQVASLALFGSRVRGDARSDSDLDVVARFRVTPSLFTWLKMEHELTDLLGVKVDLVLGDSLHPDVAAQVAEESLRV
jgi:predicted nucleotidyltransferase